MNNHNGYISLHRQIMDWEWYKDSNTKALFIHLIINANYIPARFMGKKIKRGQIVTSLSSLSNETGLSIQEVKTALKHLKSTNEITNESTHQYRIITVVNYEKYQMPTNDLTNEQQTTNKRLTNDQQQYNKNNKNNKGINNREGASRFTPPTKTQISDYCRENGIKIDEDRFFDYYESNGWMVGRNRMKDWKATVRNWAKREEENGNGGYRQHRGAAEKPVWQDYSDLKRRT